ncbi:MAG: anaerobic nitric oxide reductase flavorubredoxin, partial [Firmicutes bacterium]|nr:anaerobic nitric oxide reductase flavorubredoxin [Bacillota bacterium]
ELYQEALKYYANILTPFSRLVAKKIAEVVSLNLPINMICPSHGVIWRQEPLQIIERYQQWAQDYQENQITIVYDTMWNGTRRMAEAIAEGIREADGQVRVVLFNSARSDKNDILTEVFKSKAILVGSPTVNKGTLFSIAGFLEVVRGLGFKLKKAAAFGSYGWSGEAVGIITSALKEARFEIVNDGLNLPWAPDEQGLTSCIAFGKDFALRCR